MGFWIYMLIMNSLIPFSLIGFGLLFTYKPPKKIGYLYGYRTSMSMKNQDTWKFAHYYIGKLWNILGWILLFISTGVMVYLFKKDEDAIGRLSLMLMGLQILFLIGPIIVTETALKKTFDKEGKYREKY